MKMPGKVRSMIDEMEGLSSPDKAKLVRHLNDMADSLPEHPSPAEASRIVKGAMKQLEIKVGKAEKKEEPKEEPKKEKKETVKESKAPRKLTFKMFLESKTAVTGDEIVAAAKKFFTPQGFDDSNIYRQEIEMNITKRGGDWKKEAFNRSDIKKLFNDIGLEHFLDDFCDSMALAESLDASKQFSVKWKGYPGKTKAEKVGVDFFAEDNGFEQEDIDEILRLPVRGEHTMGGMNDSVTVTRLK